VKPLHLNTSLALSPYHAHDEVLHRTCRLLYLTLFGLPAGLTAASAMAALLGAIQPKLTDSGLNRSRFPQRVKPGFLSGRQFGDGDKLLHFAINHISAKLHFFRDSRT
jgi:hypothetical protein